MIATLSEIHLLSNRVKEFVFQLPEAVVFAAGQFVVVSLEVQNQRYQRSYSIANVQSGKTQEITLCIALNEKGAVTPWLFQQSVGLSLEMSEPQGGFLLRDTSPTVPCAFVCTGTGVAPFRSMIRERLQSNDCSPVVLVMGNRVLTDVLYHQEWQQLSEKEPRFRYIPVLSRSSELAIPDFQKGYVHEHYRTWLENKLDAHIYVCGWEVMCREARQTLKDLGYNRRQYFFEQYDG